MNRYLYKSGGVLKLQFGNWVKSLGKTDYSDKPTFGEAWTAAKKDGEKVFLYKEKRYNTKDSGEKENIIRPDKQAHPLFYEDRNYLFNYLSHPTSRKKLADRGFTKEQIRDGLNNISKVKMFTSDLETYPEDIQKQLNMTTAIGKNDEYRKALQGLPNMSNNIPKYRDILESVLKIPATDNKLLKLRIKANIDLATGQNVRGAFYPEFNSILLSANRKLLGLDHSTVPLHELAHSTNFDSKFNNSLDKASYNHTETFPRMIELKKTLNVKPGEKINFDDPAIINKIKNSKWFENENNIDLYMDPNFKKIFNEQVSLNKTKNIPYAKSGGMIVNKNTIPVEIADNDFKKTQGLQHRKAVPMFFPNTNGPMHMKNVQNISFLFIKNGTVLDIQRGKANSDELHSNKEAEHVLEVPKGFVERHNLRVGSPLQFKYQEGGLMDGAKEHLSGVEQTMYKSALKSGNTKAIKFLEDKISKGVHNANITRNQEIERMAEKQGEYFSAKQRLERNSGNEGTIGYGMSNRQMQHSVVLPRQSQTKIPLGNINAINTPERIEGALDGSPITNLIADMIPVLGDIKGFYEALKNKDKAGFAMAGIGLIPAGDIFKPIMKKYKNHKEMFVDFIQQAEKQGIKVNKESPIYQEALNNIPEARSYYNKKDILDEMFGKVNEKAFRMGYDDSKERMAFHKATHYEHVETDRRDNINDYKERIKKDPEELIKLYAWSKNRFDMKKPEDRFAVGRTYAEFPKYLDKLELDNLRENRPGDVVDALDDYESNAILDPKKADEQWKLAELMRIDKLPKVKKSNMSSNEKQKRFDEIVNLRKDLKGDNNPDIRKYLSEEERIIREQIYEESKGFGENSKTFLKNLFSKKPKELTDDQYASGLYLSTVTPEFEKMQYPFKEWHGGIKFFGRGFKPNRESYELEGNGKAGWFSGKKVDELTPEISQAGQNRFRFKYRPNMDKSLFRDHLGKWDPDNPDVHKAVTGLGVVGLSAYSANRDKNKPLFKKGGIVPHTMNVIPRGVAHARKNSINPKHGLGPKGIPVINDKREKEAEIESMELTLNKKLTDKLHDIYYKWKSNKSTALEMQAGMVLFTELQHNTADLSGKFLKPKGDLKMQTGGLMILDEKGNPQAEISNGIRIFSRVATKEIIRLFKSKDILKLGKYTLKELFAQDKREPEFTNE